MESLLLLPLGPDSDIFTLKAENFRSDSVHRLPSVSPHPREILDVTNGFKDALRRLQTLIFPPKAFWEI